MESSSALLNEDPPKAITNLFAKRTNTNLERASELVWDAIKLIDKNNYRQIRRTLEMAFDMIDNQVDYEDEQAAWQEDK